MPNAIATTITGRFVHSKRSTWDAFEDSDGRKVPAGDRFTVWVLKDPDTDAAEVIEVRVPVEMGSEVDKLTFGVEVKIAADARPYRNSLRYSATSIAAAASAGK